jgi:ubiquinone/menaquinone biosynthesis C-methylase UbiE
VSGEASDFVGSIPEHYDRGLGPMIFVDYAEDIAMRTARYNPQRVLELAAGTGIVTRQLRDHLPAAAVLIATDLNPPMLEVAKAKFGPNEKIEVRPADATQVPFPDAAFDAVVCQFGVMFFTDKDQSYREVRRVLAPGGRYLFSVWDAQRHNAFGRIAHEIPARFFAADPPSFYRVPFGYHEIDPIKESLIAAGFTNIVVRVLRLEKKLADAAAFARGLVFGNPMIDQIRVRGVEPERVVEALSEALRAEFGDHGLMPMQAILFEAIKPQA